MPNKTTKVKAHSRKGTDGVRSHRRKRPVRRYKMYKGKLVVTGAVDTRSDTEKLVEARKRLVLEHLDYIDSSLNEYHRSDPLYDPTNVYDKRTQYPHVIRAIRKDIEEDNFTSARQKFKKFTKDDYISNDFNYELKDMNNLLTQLKRAKNKKKKNE